MNQAFETELQVVLRALGEVVLPALGGAEKHVVEQLQLSMVALDFIRQRLPYAGRFYRSELEGYATLADAVTRVIIPHAESNAAEMPALAKTARTLLKDPKAGWSDYIEATHQLREAISAATERSAGTLYESEVDHIVMAAARDMHLQSRLWYQPFGFELDPGALPFAAWA